MYEETKNEKEDTYFEQEEAEYFKKENVKEVENKTILCTDCIVRTNYNAIFKTVK